MAVSWLYYSQSVLMPYAMTNPVEKDNSTRAILYVIILVISFCLGHRRLALLYYNNTRTIALGKY